MRRRRPTLLAVAATLCLALPAVGTARPAPHSPTDAVAGSADLWASINKCDTKAAPDTIGVRGSMPGLGGRRTVASMRFRVQFRRPSDGRWQDAGAAAQTDWERIGTTSDEVLQSGHDFVFQPPAGGGRHVLRGVVDYRWSRRGAVVRRATRVTTAGHPSSAGGDPATFSAATCTIR